MEDNAETGFPAVKHNRLNPRNRFTKAHWVNLQKAGNRDPGKKGVCQRENFATFPAKQAHLQLCSQKLSISLVTYRYWGRDPHIHKHDDES